MPPRRPNFLVLCPTLVLALVLGSCSERARVRVIKLGHGLSPAHPVHLAMVFLADRVRAKSGGELRVEVYPSGQLGTERECLELLQIGSLGMTKVSAAVMEAFAPSYKVFNLPYLFENGAHMHAVLGGPVGRQILDDGQAFWLRGLCYYDAGFRSFYTAKKPVHTPDDLKGLKIRTQESPTAFALVRSMGGSATPIAWGELYTALQQGVVDGAENNPPSFHLSKHYEVCKYYTLNEHTAVPDVLLISTKVWERLTPEQQRWLQAAADESAVHQRELWKKASDDAMAEVERAGVQILRPNKQSFATKVKGMDDLYRSDAPLYDLIQRIRSQHAESR